MFATHWTQKQQDIICSLCAAVKSPCPRAWAAPGSPCVWGWPQVPRAHLFLLPGCLPCLENPILPLLLLYKKRDFSWWSSFSMQKLGSSRLPSYLLKLGTWIFKSQENSVCSFEQPVDAFASELIVTEPSSQPAALVSALPVILASQNSKRRASPGEWSSGCLFCLFLSSSGSPGSATLCCTECLAPKFPACVSPLGRTGFVAHLWGSNSPLLLVLLGWFPLPHGLGACRVFGSFHSGLCNIWLYLGFCRAYRKVVLKHWLC